MKDRAGNEGTEYAATRGPDIGVGYYVGGDRRTAHTRVRFYTEKILRHGISGPEKKKTVKPITNLNAGHMETWIQQVI